MNIYRNLFGSMVNHMYPSQLQLNKVNVSDTDVSFLDLNLLISDDSVKAKIYDKRMTIFFYNVNFPFLDGDISRGHPMVWCWYSATDSFCLPC